jgi:hypothetical protein
MTSYLLAEDGSFILAEDGSRIIAENSLIGTLVGPSLLSGGPISSTAIAGIRLAEDAAPAALPFDALIEKTAVDIIHLVRIEAVTRIG